MTKLFPHPVSESEQHAWCSRWIWSRRACKFPAWEARPRSTTTHSTQSAKLSSARVRWACTRGCRRRSCVRRRTRRRGWVFTPRSTIATRGKLLCQNSTNLNCFTSSQRSQKSNQFNAKWLNWSPIEPMTPALATWRRGWLTLTEIKDRTTTRRETPTRVAVFFLFFTFSCLGVIHARQSCCELQWCRKRNLLPLKILFPFSKTIFLKSGKYSRISG